MQVQEKEIILITKHLKGAASAAEESLLAKWLEESDRHKEAYDQLKFLWNAGKNPIHEAPDVENAWNKVKLKTIGKTEVPGKAGKVRSLYSVNNFIKIAASLILIIAAGYSVMVYKLSKEAFTEIITQDNNQEIMLPDGSKVWLYRNSKLSYKSDNFNKNDRTVIINGEAFFEVTKNPERPFIVNGRASRTEVLGTSFYVRSLSDSVSDEVQVLTGKVSFEAKSDMKGKVYLLPGDKAFVRENGEVEKTKIKDPNAFSWKSKRLIFNNSSLDEVTEAAKNHFGIGITIANSDLLDCRFTGSFTNPEIEEVMKVLSVSMNLSYNKSDSSYVLSGKGCK